MSKLMISYPLVSIMVPYYNCKVYIAETITSIDAQTYPNIEIIIVDDGSSPEDAEYLKNLLTGRSDIIYSAQDNRGLSSARNHAAQLAHGKYFCFLDADDVIHPEYIQSCVDIFEKNPECKLVYSRAEFFDAQTGEWNLPEYTDFKTLLKGNHIPAFAVHYSDDYKGANGFDETLKTHEDWDFWIRLLKDGGRAIKLPTIFFYYRKRKDQSSLTDSLLKNSMLDKESWQRVYDKNKQLFISYGLGYYDLIREMNYTNREISVLKNEINAYIANEQELTFKNKQLNDREKIYKSLWVIKLFNPLIKLEKIIRSFILYFKGFRMLIRDKGSIGKAYQSVRKIIKKEGVKSAKQFLKGYTA